MKRKFGHVSRWGLSIILSIFLFFPIGCEKEEEVYHKKNLNEFLKALPSISEEMPEEKEATLVDIQEDTVSEYIYHTEYYEAAAGFNEQIVLNPQTDVIYPGALIKGESILDGTYTLIPAERKPITISTSLTGGENVSIEIEDPKLSTIREAINELMNQDYDVPYANMGFTVEQAYSEKQLDLSLHASYKGGIVNVKGGFDFSNKQVKTRMVAKFIQNYYTLDMDMPMEPSDLFKGDVNQSLFGTFMPMYVSTVTFGRMALFTIESEYSEQEVKTYLDASYAGVEAESSADFDALMEKSTMKAYILGGSGSDAATTINGFGDFKKYIQEGGNFSKSSPGAPISYKLRYISDNSIGKIVFAASYPIVTAIPRTDNVVYDITTTLYSFRASVGDAGSHCEIYGNIKSWPKSLGDAESVYHFNSGASTHISMGLSSTWYFAENIETKRLWEGLKQDDAIMIFINLSEVDDFSPDDHYGDMTFEIPVSEILASLGQGFYEKSNLKVYDGGDYVDVTFQFAPKMRHTSKIAN